MFLCDARQNTGGAQKEEIKSLSMVNRSKKMNYMENELQKKV